MKTIDEMIAVMQAYIDGAKIEKIGRCYPQSDYEEDEEPNWNWGIYDYRVKPEPQYVPYDSVLEVERDKWVKRKGYPSLLYSITLLNLNEKWVLVGGCGRYALENLFKDYEYEDGTPCGKAKGEQNG